MTERLKCAGCEMNLSFRWSDTHGVAVCIECGLPYRLYHYEGEGENEHRVDKAPECLIKPEWLEVGRRYRKETGRTMFPAEFDMGILRGDTHSYSGATKDDILEWERWLVRHRAELPGYTADATA